MSIDNVETRISGYEYDVAFSFLSQDEPLATTLSELLQDRYRTFLYSKRQEVVGGTDGELSFGRVFEEQSRLVVVLYRKGWGESPWTRVEETAIRNRGHEEGYDFAKFIPLDDDRSVPRWVPKNHVWIDHKRWGLQSTARVIEARIRDLGGDSHEETVEQRAARLGRDSDFARERDRWRRCGDGVGAAQREFDALISELGRLIESVGQSTPSVALALKTFAPAVAILGLRHGMSVRWRREWANDLADSVLEVTLWDGHPDVPGLSFYKKPRKLGAVLFDFDLVPPGELAWLQRDVGGRTYDTAALASFILKHYMDHGGLPGYR